MHSIVGMATMYVGESQAMASEAAVLGTPEIRMNSFVGRIAYLEELEHKYGLAYGFKHNQFEGMVDKIKKLLNITLLKKKWNKKIQKLLDDKIDVTSFFVWFIENYPNSFSIITKNPQFTKSFINQ